VVLAAGDDASAARLVPWGPRAQAARGDALALAQMAFRALDEKAAARALAAGGGFVVAGARFGGGPQEEAAARVLAALGVRVVLASTYDGGQERQLALHGVLPLRWQRPDDTAALAAGDTLEIAGLPEALAPERRLAIRDLTHGRTFLVSHALAPHLLDVVREGGLLGLIKRAQVPAGGSAT
jgi:aconitate hydratase